MNGAFLLCVLVAYAGVVVLGVEVRRLRRLVGRGSARSLKDAISEINARFPLGVDVSRFREVVDSRVEEPYRDDYGCEFVAEDRNVPGMVSLADAVKRIELGREHVEGVVEVVADCTHPVNVAVSEGRLKDR